MLVVGAFDDHLQIPCSGFGFRFRSDFSVSIIQWFRSCGTCGDHACRLIQLDFGLGLGKGRIFSAGLIQWFHVCGIFGDYAADSSSWIWIPFWVKV